MKYDRHECLFGPSAILTVQSFCSCLSAFKLGKQICRRAMVDAYPGLIGAARRAAMWRDHGLSLPGLSDKMLPFKVRPGNPPVPFADEPIIERHPLNNRQYNDLAEEYAQRFFSGKGIQTMMQVRSTSCRLMGGTHVFGHLGARPDAKWLPSWRFVFLTIPI